MFVSNTVHFQVSLNADDHWQGLRKNPRVDINFRCKWTMYGVEIDVFACICVSNYFKKKKF